LISDLQTAAAAQRLKASGVKVIAVGVGQHISNNELLTIASTPADIFSVNDYSVLNDIKQELTVSTCNGESFFMMGIHLCIYSCDF
jgi:von Willebrand factor type A domain